MSFRTTRTLLAATLVFGASSAAAAQRSAPPPVAAPKDFKVPAKREFTLPNGMAVTLVPYGVVPKANVSLAVRTGRIDVGQFVLNLRALRLNHFRDLRLRLPLHQRQQFRRLHAQRNRKLLGRVELAPLALVAVAEDAGRQLVDRRVVRHGDAVTIRR